MLGRVLAAAGIVVVSAAAVAGCDLVDPCNSTGGNELDTRWSISRVNGAPIPPAGIVIPDLNVLNPKKDRLVFGVLNFATTLSSGGCKDASSRVEDSGRVTVGYTIVDSLGRSKGLKTYAGAFTYNHKTRAVTLRADKNSITGRRVVNDLSFEKTLPLLGTYIVTFVKVK